MSGPLTFQEAVAQLARVGIILRPEPGQYRVNYKGGKAATEYFTDTLADAVAHGLAMEPQPAPLAPLGPTGGARSRRGEMIQHNRKLAARRRRQAAKATQCSADRKGDQPPATE